MYGDTPNNLVGAHSSDMVRAQKAKFNVSAKNDLMDEQPSKRG